MAINTAGKHNGTDLTPEPFLGNPGFGQRQMEPLETPAKEIEQLFEKVQSYGTTTLELAKLKSLNVASKIVTSLVSKLAAATMFAMFLIVINIGTSIYLGELLEKVYYGFFIVALVNLAIAVLLYFFLHPFIKRTLGQSIIREALD